MQGLACSSMACVTSTCYNAAHLGNFRVLASLEQLVLRFLGKEVSGQAHRDVPLEELPATKGSSSHPEGRRQRGSRLRKRTSENTGPPPTPEQSRCVILYTRYPGCKKTNQPHRAMRNTRPLGKSSVSARSVTPCEITDPSDVRCIVVRSLRSTCPIVAQCGPRRLARNLSQGTARGRSERVRTGHQVRRVRTERAVPYPPLVTLQSLFQLKFVVGRY